MRFVEAWAFRCPLSLAELEQMLERVTSWPWIARDSDTYGDYLKAVTMDPGELRIFKDLDRFVLDVRYDARDADAAAAWPRYREHLLDEVLRSVGATDIQRTDSYG